MLIAHIITLVVSSHMVCYNQAIIILESGYLIITLEGAHMETESSAGRTLIILNPAANRGHIDRIRAMLRTRLPTLDADYVETTRRGEAGTLAQTAATQGRPIVIVGGDGTLNEVASGIIASGQRVPLGIVAAGSGNDFASNALKLPKDFAAAIEIALHGTPTAIDAGSVNDRYFVNSLGIGLDADITVVAERMKRLPLMTGPVLYYSASLRQLFFGYRNCPWLRITIDDVPLDSELHRYVLAAIMNGPTYGAGFHITPQAVNTDGYFDICTIRYTPWLRAIRLLPVVKRGEHTNLPEVTFYRARSVVIEAPQTINVQMDGETWQAQRFAVRILPKALLVRQG